MTIDWTDEKDLITEHFRVKDALLLHEWNRMADVEKDGVVIQRIIKLCEKMEEIRQLLNAPIYVTSMFRSIAYNRELNINPVNDAHSASLACDFNCGDRLTIEEIKDALRTHLSSLNIRMEKGTTNWVHIDMRLPSPEGREFVP